MQCAVLPDSSRMLSYTDVTDIIRHSDELETLRYALDNVWEGVVLLDADLNAQFLNKRNRLSGAVSDERTASRPPAYASLIANAPHARDEQNDGKLSRRSLPAASPRGAFRGREPLRDLKTADRRHIPRPLAVLENNGRMLTYSRRDRYCAQRRATRKVGEKVVNSMTGLYNRRHFLDQADAEWNRFERYQRPLSMLMVDIDHFKQVNDRYGHARPQRGPRGRSPRRA